MEVSFIEDGVTGPYLFYLKKQENQTKYIKQQFQDTGQQ